ncbi:MAG: dTDP-4-dehydrorhamnose 3,5-epimerase [Pigmentiphaga sp.]
MHVQPLSVPGPLLLTPHQYPDRRGRFYESFNPHDFAAATGLDVDFVQDNHSESHQGVLRGLHYQLPPHTQGKLVRVVAGEVYDVVVDLRHGSATFGRWAAARLNAADARQLWIPPGFAHGFLTLSEQSILLYKTTRHYRPEAERCLRWDDPGLAIPWPLADAPILSARDQDGEFLDALESIALNGESGARG